MSEWALSTYRSADIMSSVYEEAVVVVYSLLGRFQYGPLLSFGCRLIMYKGVLDSTLHNLKRIYNQQIVNLRVLVFNKWDGKF